MIKPKALKYGDTVAIVSLSSGMGGDDSIRLLPYINYDAIRKNPKIFMGYSDSTVNHFMMYRAGLVSFYGSCVLVEFAENQQMHEYTIDSIRRTLFHVSQSIDIAPSPKWTSEFLDWSNMKNQNVRRKMQHDNHGFEVLQGTGIATRELIGGVWAFLK